MQNVNVAFLGIMSTSIILLGVGCLIFNRMIGAWLKRHPLLFTFGMKPLVEVDEIIFRGLICLLGLFYAGFGLILLATSLR